MMRRWHAVTKVLASLLRAAQARALVDKRYRHDVRLLGETTGVKGHEVPSLPINRRNRKLGYRPK